MTIRYHTDIVNSDSQSFVGRVKSRRRRRGGEEKERRRILGGDEED